MHVVHVAVSFLGGAAVVAENLAAEIGELEVAAGLDGAVRCVS